LVNRSMFISNLLVEYGLLFKESKLLMAWQGSRTLRE
jgi:hypothetical protein